MLFFSSTVNELGRLIHTLNKISQILPASSEASVEATKKITIFGVKADGHEGGTRDLGLRSTMHCWTKAPNKNTGIETPKAPYNETWWVTQRSGEESVEAKNSYKTVRARNM